jgi:hypothetical protein
MTASRPKPAFERTDQQLRYWLPSSLRSSAAAQRERWAPRTIPFPRNRS